MSRRVIPFIVTVALLGAVCAFVGYPLAHLVVQWRSFVHRAKSTINPHELQDWATNLAALHRGDYYFDAHGTNIPPQLAALFPHRPCVGTIPDQEVVIVAWGRGYPSIRVGPPNYVVTNRPAELLSPGVYLMKPND